MARVDQRFYDRAERSEGAIWKVCAYLSKEHGQKCKKCPAYEGSDFGPITRMCRALAAETIAVVLASLEPPKPMNDDG